MLHIQNHTEIYKTWDFCTCTIDTDKYWEEKQRCPKNGNQNNNQHIFNTVKNKQTNKSFKTEQFHIQYRESLKQIFSVFLSSKHPMDWLKYKWKVSSGSTTLSWVHKWFHSFPSCLGVTADKSTFCRTSVSNRKAVYCCSVKVADAQLIFLSSISICSPVVLWLA